MCVMEWYFMKANDLHQKPKWSQPLTCTRNSCWSRVYIYRVHTYRMKSRWKKRALLKARRAKNNHRQRPQQHQQQRRQRRKRRLIQLEEGNMENCIANVFVHNIICIFVLLSLHLCNVFIFIFRVSMLMSERLPVLDIQIQLSAHS